MRCHTIRRLTLEIFLKDISITNCLRELIHPTRKPDIKVNFRVIVEKNTLGMFLLCKTRLEDDINVRVVLGYNIWSSDEGIGVRTSCWNISRKNG